MSAEDYLFDVTRENDGRHTAMLERAIAAAKDSGRLEEIDEALLSIARANAHALDAAEATAKPYYPIAQLTGPYREVLEALRMTPADRESEANDELASALAELSAATVRDA